MKNNKPKKQNVRIAQNLAECNAVTHSGTFHGDDVMACAILSLVENEVSLIRTRDYDTICEKRADHRATIFDVGGRYDPSHNMFDHHQNSFKRTRDDGMPYASSGLLWEHYGEDILLSLYDCPKEYVKDVCERVDRVLIRGIDARDYGIEPNSFSLSITGLVSLYNPLPGSRESQDDQFIQITEIVKKALKRVILYSIAAEKEKRLVKECVDNITDTSTQVLVLPREYIGWQSTVVNMDSDIAKRLKFVIFENEEFKRYDVMALTLDTSIYQDEEKLYRQNFPEEWKGLNAPHLAEVTNVKTALFCHKNGKRAAAETKEDAIKLANLALSWESTPIPTES